MATPTATRTHGNTPLLLVSASQRGSVDGVAFQDEDILAYDAVAKRWSLLLDGSDVGLGNVDLEAFDLLPDGSFLLTLSKNLALPGLGTVTPSDILRFAPSALGQTSAGRFEWYFDGSDVDLTTTSEYIDALALDQNGHLLISTAGAFKVGNATLGDDEDLFTFTHSSLGANTAGVWALLFDGSRVALTTSNEDVDAAWVDPTNGDLYLSTKGNFAVVGTMNGLTGDKNDLLVCMPLGLAAATNCNFSFFLDGDMVRFPYDIDDLAIVPANRLLPFWTGVTDADDAVHDDNTAVIQYPVVMTAATEVDVDPELTVVDQDAEEAPVQRLLFPIIIKQ